MKGLENIDQEMAKDLIKLVNNLKGLEKTAKVEYNVKNKDTGKWTKKEFKYVPLDNILNKIKEDSNFALLQPIGIYNEKVGIKCILIHKSGKYLESEVYPIKESESSKIQDEGAEITYRKRYSISAFLGIATDEDTDGNDDNATQPKTNTPSPYDFVEEGMSDDEIFVIANLDEENKNKIRIKFKKDPITLTKKEYQSLIPSLIKKGLYKTREDVEKERKESEEVFQ